MLSKEQNGLHQAFQYLFSRKSKIVSSQEISPFTSRSNSNVTINSLLSPTPTPSTSITFSEKEEPWRLLDDGNIHHDYFFMDRQDLYTMNDTTERFNLFPYFYLSCSNIVQIRDSYGFKRPTQWVQIKHLHQFDIYYQPILDEQQLNWNCMLNQCQGIYPPVNSITRMYTFLLLLSVFIQNNNNPLIIHI